MTTTQSAAGLSGLKVVAFEARMAKEMYKLIANQGGQPLLVPAMREVSIDENRAALNFGDRWLGGGIDVLILLTGVGLRKLVELLETRHPKDRILGALKSVKIVCRGPKPVSVLAEWGLKPDVVAPEPNTWKTLLATLDEKLEIHGKRVAVQEYGNPNEALYDGLADRGAEVTRVPVYHWALPEDLLPLQAGIKELAEGRADVALFTSSPQVAHVTKVAQQLGLGRAFRKALLTQVAVGAVGPSTTEALKEFGLAADFEPDHPKMGHLVLAAAGKAKGVIAAKQARAVHTVPPPAGSPEAAQRLHDSAFMKACRREQVPFTPVWLMRQAGRYMKEYRALREEVGFLDLCRNADLCAEVTVHAVERLNVDAAIIFSDLLIVTEPMGFPVAYTRGEGPVISRPIRKVSDIDRVLEMDPQRSVPYAFEAIRKTRAQLPPDIPLIGFAGAPFTLASYLIEGEGSRNFIHTKKLMRSDPEAWNTLLDRLVNNLIPFVNGQVAAGAQVIQFFDSWVGCLSPEDYRSFVLPHSKKLIAGVTNGTPVIHFGTGTGTFIEEIRHAGGSVIGIDWRLPMPEARKRLGKDVTLMGNLDPVTLFSPVETIKADAERIITEMKGASHVFNLGHGILPGTPVDSVKALIDFVHDRTKA